MRINDIMKLCIGMISAVPSKHNVVLTRKDMHYRGMAPILFTSIHPAINWVNTHKRIGCHACLISDYSSTNKSSLMRECDIVLGQYCMHINGSVGVATRKFKDTCNGLVKCGFVEAIDALHK